MLKYLTGAIGALATLPAFAVGLNTDYLFNIDDTQSSLTLTLQTSTGNSSPTATTLFGDFTLNLGDGTGPALPLNWNVPIELELINAGTASDVILQTPDNSGNGLPDVDLTVSNISLLDWDKMDNDSGTLAGGPPLSSGVVNTEVQFDVTASGQVDTALGRLPIGTNPANYPAWSNPVDWTVELSETTPGQLLAHVTATTAFDLVQGNPNFGSIQVAMDFYGTASHSVPPSAVPLPGAVWLFCSGLLALGGIRRDRTPG